MPDGRVSDPDPDSFRSVEPDPYSESGSGSRRAKMTHKSRITIYGPMIYTAPSIRILMRADG